MEKETQSEITKKSISRDQLLSSGSALVNLACSDNVHGAFLPGKYYLIVGASSAGKTWLATSIMAESSLHSRFKDYKLIYDNIEDGNEIDLEFYFGAKTVERIKAPRYEKEDPIYSVTVEDFYDNINNAFEETEKTGIPFIYILDSQDALTSVSEVEKSEDNKKLREKGKDTTGSYGDGKAKVHSSNLRYVTSRLGRSGSILFIISQERDDIGSMFGGSTFSGGRALTFYASLQLWLKYQSDLKVTINGKERIIGNIASISIKKNRLTGQRHRDIEIPINNHFGMDDIGSCIDYLVYEKYFSDSEEEEKEEEKPKPKGRFGNKKPKPKAGKINFSELEFVGSKSALIKHIEENNLEKKLYSIVWKCWRDIKTALSEKFARKRKYD